MWELLRKKDVLDIDGFWTEYALYKNGEIYVCIFGDTDLYTPENADWDFETQSALEAVDWFEAYDTLVDEDEEDF